MRSRILTQSHSIFSQAINWEKYKLSIGRLCGHHLSKSTQLVSSVAIRFILLQIFADVFLGEKNKCCSYCSFIIQDSEKLWPLS